MSKLEIGDFVHVHVDGHGSPGHDAYVIGWPHYSDGLHDVVLLATEQYVGAPYAAKWCRPLGSADAAVAKQLGDRFAELYPNFIKRPTSPPAGDR